LPFSLASTLAYAAPPADKGHKKDSKTPIKHVIVIVGENRSFDHIFATYKPKQHGESVDSLLSKQITRGWRARPEVSGAAVLR
jgi:phospholipase C